MENLKCVSVDDDKTSLTILGALIRNAEGLSLVGEYDNYIDAVTNITKINPDIIFLDINMPGLSGPELFELLIKKPLVIVVSGDKTQKTKLLKDPHIISYLDKPVTRSNFNLALLELMEKRVEGQSRLNSRSPG